MSSIGLWALCTIIPLAFGLWAQMKVKRTFARYSQVAPRNGMSGAEAAAAVLRSSGLPNLQIKPVAGRLTDHYDPRNRTLNLSQDVGEAKESLPVQFSGDPLEIGFNAEFLREGIESLAADEVQLRLISPLRPAVIEGGEDDPTYLIMPIRLPG